MSINPEERVLVIIDGGNTYQALFKPNCDKNGKEIAPPMVGKGFIFSFKDFTNYLINGRKSVDVRYYVGIVRNVDHTEKSQLMVEGQQKFLQKLENDSIKIERGRIVYDHKPREKGVDVKMAIDIVLGAVNDEYDSVVLISSDTDLMPAITYSQSKGKKIEYVGFSHRYSNALLNSATEKRLLAPSDVQAFCVGKTKSIIDEIKL